jgi:hypothetical protein
MTQIVAVDAEGAVAGHVKQGVCKSARVGN